MDGFIHDEVIAELVGSVDLDALDQPTILARRRNPVCNSPGWSRHPSPLTEHRGHISDGDPEEVK